MSARTGRLTTETQPGNTRLIVERRPGEAIHVGDNIIVTIVEVRGKHVHVAVEAPATMPIHRHEHFDQAPANPPATHRFWDPTDVDDLPGAS